MDRKAYQEVQDYQPPMHYVMYKKLINKQSGSVMFRPVRYITLYYNIIL